MVQNLQVRRKFAREFLFFPFSISHFCYDYYAYFRLFPKFIILLSRRALNLWTCFCWIIFGWLFRLLFFLCIIHAWFFFLGWDLFFMSLIPYVLCSAFWIWGLDLFFVVLSNFFYSFISRNRIFSRLYLILFPILGVKHNLDCFGSNISCTFFALSFWLLCLSCFHKRKNLRFALIARSLPSFLEQRRKKREGSPAFSKKNF